jgi:D-alanine-D-alanine ligase
VRRPRWLEFPLIVKSLVEEASFGIAQASVVYDDESLAERVQFIHERVRTDAIAEQFIEGRELYTAVLGNHQLQVLPIWELFLDGLPDDALRIATRKAKWDLAYQKKHGIDHGRARRLGDALERRIADTARRICRRLGIDGYARIDFRLADDGELYFLEANPNPDIADREEFASAAAAAGMSYLALLQRIVSLGIRRSAP